MNLELARKILEISEAQPFDFVKLRGRGIAWEVREMESAGLIALSAAQNDDPDLAVIKSVTHAGRALLMVLRDKATARSLKRALATIRVPSVDLDLELALL
jgi:hypothetical protein